MERPSDAAAVRELEPVAPASARSGGQRLAAFARLLEITAAVGIAGGVYVRERFRAPGRGAERRQRAAGRALLHLGTRLGATFIKIGQILSTRADLLPQPLLDELAAIQDRVPPFPLSIVVATIESELGRALDEVFDRFEEEPVAAGSIAQVHRAVLRATGETVAIKIRRPDVRRKMALDRAVLMILARAAERVRPSLRTVSLHESVREFCDAVERQLDFVREAESNRRLREVVAAARVHDYVIPITFAAASSEGVLTMEWVEGLREHELPGSAVDLAQVIRTVVRGLSRAIFTHGFVHADPHPGNIRFLPPGQIVLMDFGLVAELEAEERLAFARMWFAIGSGDGVALAKTLYEQAPRRDVRDYRAYEAELVAFAASMRRRALRDLDLVRDIGGLFDILRRHGVQLRSNTTMVYVALLAMEGLSKRLAPDFELFREFLPYVAEGLELLPRERPDPRPAGSPPAAATSGEEWPSFGSGRYRAVRLLGEGARKRVYAARDSVLDREVAVSMLKSDPLDVESLARLMLEARALAGLGDHPRIVSIFDFGREDGRAYFVSELMAGGTLEELLERRESRGLPVADAIRIAGQICQALAHAHARGVLHSDVKPANVWLTTDGFAKLGDFSLASAPERMPRTPRGAIVGTVAYMAPEQALGQPIEPRSDLYAIGCLLHEMLTGEPPFVGDAAAVLASHLQKPATPPSLRNREVPSALDTLVVRCLAKMPAERPESAEALGRELAAIAVPKPDALETPPLDDPVRRELFVGREAELRQLVAAFDDAARGRGRISLLSGEPGIGKTRTASELGMHARRRGARVLLGRCHEGEGAPAFWPWVQILRAYVQAREPKALAAEAGLAAAVIAQLVPELRDRIPELAPPPLLEGEAGRFRLFDAITRFLVAAAAAQPLVLLLDDLHWADKPSLLFLGFLAREIEDARIHVVATYRDVEVQRGHPLAEVLPSLRRAPGHERLRLRGLAEGEVHTLLAALGGKALAPPVARAIHRETEGNPFFVGEVLSHLLEEGKIDEAGAAEIGIPESIRDVIGRRLARLGEPARRALTVASVIGREFDLAVLALVAEVEGGFEPAIAEAVAAGVLVEVPRTPGRRRFAHALIREALYGDLPSTERLALHRRVAEALEQAPEGASRRLSEIAYHWAEAATLGDVDKAITSAILAGEQATAQLAFEAAVRHFEQALACLALGPEADEERRADLLLRLGEALFGAGEYDRARTTFFEAATIAERNGDAERLGRAALGFGGGLNLSFDSTVPSAVITLFESALAALATSPGPTRAKVTARLAVALSAAAWIGNAERTRARLRIEMLAREVIAMARQSGDAEALAFVLGSAAWALQSPDTLEERLALIAESLGLAQALQNRRLEIGARILLGQFRAELGDLATAAAQAAVLERMPEATRDPYVRWLLGSWEAARATFEGRFADAEHWLADSMATGEESGNRDAVATGYAQLVAIRLFQGSASGAVEMILALTRRFSDVGYLHLIRPSILTEFTVFEPTTMLPAFVADTRQVLRGLVEERCTVRHGMSWLVEACIYAEMAATIGDVELAARLAVELLPFADRCLTLARFMLGGSVARTLGVVAMEEGRFADAERFFERAWEMNRRMGSPPLTAYTQFNQARLRLRRRAPGDRESALALLGEATDTFRQLGMTRFVEAAIALRLEAQGAGGRDPAGSIHAVADSVEVRRPDLAAHAASDGTVTLLFSDVEGFSAMTERLGDRRAHEVMREHNEIVRAELAAHEGAEVELLGDGFLLAFASPSRGVECAIAIQRRFASYNESRPAEPLRVRIGIHTGEAIRDAQKFFGRAVILASRIAAHARGGEILVSALVRELAGGRLAASFGEVREIELKGLAGRHPVCTVAWSDREPASDPR